MLHYKSEYLRDPYIKELKHSIYNCYKYSLLNQEDILCSIYASQKMTLIYYGAKLLRIERKWFALTAQIFDHVTNEKIGFFKHPVWQSASKTRCVIQLNSGEVYSFVESTSHRSLWKPSTWNQYCFELSNSENQIIYSGNRKSGSVSCNDISVIIPIALGFFIIDDKFRSSDETSG